MRKTKGELAYLAERSGWTARELTWPEVQQLSSDEYAWHEIFNAAVLDAAINEPKQKAENRANLNAWNIHKQYLNGLTEEQRQTAIREGLEFLKQYPQFDDSWQNNADVFWARMQKKNRDRTSFNAFVENFEELAVEGGLRLSPRTVGLSHLPEEIEGAAIRNLRAIDLKRLIEPVSAEDIEKMRVASLSADAYRKERPELQNNIVSKQAVLDVEKEVATFRFNRPDFLPSEDAKQKLLAWIGERGAQITSPALSEALNDLVSHGELELNTGVVASAGVTSFVARDPENKGVPPIPDKYSFRKKIDSMSAEEFKRRCAEDPTFRAAIENLGR